MSEVRALYATCIVLTRSHGYVIFCVPGRLHAYIVRYIYDNMRLMAGCA